MASRTTPHLCPKCGKKSVETGIPVLTGEGLKDTFVRPPDWIVFHGDLICEECGFLNQDEIDEDTAQGVAQALRSYIRDEHKQSLRVIVRAVQILADTRSDWLEYWEQETAEEEG